MQEKIKINQKLSLRPNIDLGSDRPAVDIALPAIARHVAFRIPKLDNPRIEEILEKRREKWKVLLDFLLTYLTCINTLTKDSKIFSMVDDGYYHRIRCETTGELFDSSRSIIVDFVYDEIKAHLILRIDVYNEFIAISYMIDRIDQQRTFVATVSSPEELAGNDLCSVLAKLTADGDPDQKQTRLADIQLTWWEKSAIQPPSDGGQSSGPAAIFSKDNLILDFRGVYLNAVDGTVGPRLRPRPLNHFRPKHALMEFASRNRDFIDFAIGRAGREDSMSVRGEAVFCTMLDGVALYMAELGRRDLERKVVPLNHVVVFWDAPSSQAGRLIRRLHVMGELRHAALFDYDNGSAGDDLRAVSRQMQILSPSIDSLLMRSAVERIDSVEAAKIHAKEAQSVIDDILGKVGELKESKESRGVTFRTEQSKFYASDYILGMKQLRIGRIPGYQTYEDFMYRYLIQSFSRIEAIGNRYRAMLTRVNVGISHETLGQLFRSSQGQIDLLDRADRVGRCIIAYYLGSALHSMIDEAWREDYTVALGRFVIERSEGLTIYSFLWISILSYFAFRKPFRPGK